jgi:hypothetical protein
VEAACEALYRIVGAIIAMMLDQILIDRDGVTALGDLCLDEGGVRGDAAAARSRGGSGDIGGGLEVGGHFGRGVRF